MIQAKMMMKSILDALSPYMAQYGYLILFTLILLESAGLPLPGEAMLLLTATYAARGSLSISGVILTATLAAIIGDTAGYWLGRRAGEQALRRMLRHSGEARLEQGRAFFTRYGPLAVFLSRFFPLLRIFGAVLAGSSQMDYWKFSLYNAVGGLAWAALMGGLGYFFGQKLPLLETFVRRMGIGMLLVLVVVVATVWIGRRAGGNEQQVRKIGTRLVGWLRLPNLQQWTVKRWSRQQRLTLTLITGLLLALVAGLLFGAVAEDVYRRDSLTLYDVISGHWLLGLATEDSSQFFYGITLLGSVYAIVPGGALLALWLVRRRQWIDLFVLAGAGGGGILLNQVLKWFFMRPRPDFPNAFYHETGYSFPSGHAMMAVIFYGMVAYLLVHAVPRWHWQVGFVMSACTLALLIGFSRLFLGVHFVSDVLGGWAAGVAWLVACITAGNALQPRSSAQPSPSELI